MKTDDELRVSGKHIKLRIVLLAVCVLAAVFFFTNGVLRIGHREAGYQEVVAEPDPDNMIYAKDFRFMCYFDGSSSEIRQAAKEASSAYSFVLQRASKLLDPDSLYEDYVNIGYLNKVLNENGTTGKVILSAELYEAFERACLATEKCSGYSIFAGPLYSYWDSLLYLDDPTEFDPYYNASERKRLEGIVELINDTSYYDISLSDEEERSVTVTVSKEFLEKLRELELPESEQTGIRILDMSLLRDALAADMVAEVMNETKFTKGYITTESGIMRSLAGNASGEYVVYRLKDGKVEEKAAVPVKANMAVSCLRAFSLDKAGTPGFYTIAGNGETIYRSPYVYADTGYSTQDTDTIYSADYSEGAVAATMANIR